MSVDQGQDQWPSSPGAADGGWHIPHLYAIDLSASDFNSQASLDVYGPQVPKFRFNKIILSRFLHKLPPGVTFAYGHELTCSTMGMPSSQGPVHPGENHYEPTDRARLVAIDNENLPAATRTRLYVGANGKAETDGLFAHFWKGPAGTVHVFDLNNAAAPDWLRTAPLPKTDAAVPWYQVVGLGAVPARWIEAPFNRNVIVISGLNTTEILNVAKDRLVLYQDI